MTTDADEARLQAARKGDLEALAGLFREHHRAALAYAISLAGPVRAPDLVSEAFVRISTLIKDGRGPQDAFRPYLIRTIRSVHVDHTRRAGREIPVEDVHEALGEPTVDDGADLRFERNAIVDAFTSLPERWQSVLWFTAVEGEPLAEVAERLGIQPNAVAALSFRAREGLRLAYLREHLGRARDVACVEVAELLPRYTRGSLSGKQAELVRSHLDRCDACSDTVRVLGLVNVDLAALLLPVVIGLKLWFSVVPGGPVALASATAAPAAAAGTAITGVAVPASPAPVPSGAPALGGLRRLLSPHHALASAASLVVAVLAATTGPAVTEAPALQTTAAEIPAAVAAPLASAPATVTVTTGSVRRVARPATTSASAVERPVATSSAPSRPTDGSEATTGRAPQPTPPTTPQPAPTPLQAPSEPGPQQSAAQQSAPPASSPQRTNNGHHYGQRKDHGGRGYGRDKTRGVKAGVAKARGVQADVRQARGHQRGRR